MSSGDVKETLDMALEKTGLDSIRIQHKPRLLSDNGPCYISSELREYLEGHEIKHTRGAPFHPQTQGKIERYHRSIKNVINLQIYYLPGELEEEIRKFVDYYNNHRYHESINNLTSADVYFGRDKKILSYREKIKQRTMALRKEYNLRKGDKKGLQKLNVSLKFN
jgi:transposase InsO family protein